MVLLSQESPINPAKYPLAYRWDNTVRQNHALYQREIDKLTYQHQRTQRYFLATPFPLTYQRSVLRLALLKRKQSLGSVSRDELEQYKQLDPTIEKHFKRTFNTAPIFSKFSLFCAGGLFLSACFFNLSITHRLYTLVMPPVLSYFYNLNDIRSDHHTSQLLDWVLEKRKAECAIESMRTSIAQKLKGRVDINDIHRQYLKLVNNQ